MQMFNMVPDKTMVKIQYRIKTGHRLNLKNPKRFTEKLQWYKLNYKDPLMALCTDKLDVRKYVEDCGLENILNELYGVYETPDEIDFDILPESFVLKDTLGGGGNAIIVVQNKSDLNKNEAIKEMWNWVNEPINKKHPGREWVYDGRKHKIIAEKFLPSKMEEGGLIDYKFFCFYGVPEYLYVVADRKVGEKAGFGIFKAETYQKTDVVISYQKPLERNIKKPDSYKEMLQIAKTLSKPFPEARIDLYCVKERIYFGEITFFDGSGYTTYEPDEFDFIFGKRFQLERVNK